MNIKYILASLLLITSVHAFADILPRHGFIDSPPSRAFLCSGSGGNLNKSCGPVQYEPQSVEGLKGFPERGPADGEIASGGNATFNALNEQTSTRWYKYPMNSGENIFSWTLTAAHSTTSWRFFITKQNWDPNKPLVRADFDLTPFCEQYDNGRVPASNVRITCNVPDREGYQVILAVWDIADTGNAFYQVIDANMTNDNQNSQNEQDRQFITGARLSTSERDNGDNFSYVLEVKSNTSPASEPEYTWTLPKNARQITVSKGYSRFTIYKTDAAQTDTARVNVTAGTESKVFEYDVNVPALTGNNNLDKQFIAEARLSTSARDNGDNFSYVLEVKSNTSPASEPEYTWILPKNARQITVSKGYSRFTIYKTDAAQTDIARVNVTAGTESRGFEYDINIPTLTGNNNQDQQFITGARLSTSERDNGDNFSYVLEVKSNTSPASEPEYTWTLPKNAQQVTVSKGYSRFTIYKTGSAQKDVAKVNITAGTASRGFEYDINVPALTQLQGYDYVFPDNVASYTAGTIVLQPKDNRLYQCRPHPYSSYCYQWSATANQYEPGIGSAWETAWILLN